MSGLVKTSVLSSVGVLVRLLCVFATGKVIAVYLGPAGMFVFGQIQNIMQLLVSFAGGSLSVGITKRLAETDTELEEKREITYNIVKFSLLTFLVVSALFFLSIPFLFDRLFGSVEGLNNIHILAVGILGGALSMILLGVLNGYRLITEHTIFTICLSISTLVFTVSSIHYFGVTGMVFGFAISQIFALLIGASLYRKKIGLVLTKIPSPISKSRIASVAKYSSLSFVTALLLPIGHTTIRSILMSQGNEQLAGTWEALNRLSSAYLIFLTTTATIYLLPKFTSEKDSAKKYKTLVSALAVTVLAFLCISAFITSYADFIVRILFSKEFLIVSDHIPVQLVGDSLRVLSIILVYFLLSKGKMVELITLEISHMVFFVGYVWIVSSGDLASVVLGHALSYAFYFILLACIVYKEFVGDKNVY